MPHEPSLSIDPRQVVLALLPAATTCASCLLIAGLIRSGAGTSTAALAFFGYLFRVSSGYCSGRRVASVPCLASGASGQLVVDARGRHIDWNGGRLVVEQWSSISGGRGSLDILRSSVFMYVLGGMEAV